MMSAPSWARRTAWLRPGPRLAGLVVGEQDVDRWAVERGSQIRVRRLFLGEPQRAGQGMLRQVLIPRPALFHHQTRLLVGRVRAAEGHEPHTRPGPAMAA